MASKGTRRSPVVCSFCCKSQKEVRRLIAGPTEYICDECVVLCNDVLAKDQHKQETTPKTRSSIPKPAQIKKALDEYVVGQERAKKVLSVAVYNHYKRIDSDAGTDSVELHKSNILLLGPTGCGKTLLAQTLARILQVPFCIADATSLTEAGYVGEDVENVLASLLRAADGDIDNAQRGIVYIDEVDKTARRAENLSITRDVSGEGVQQSLLKMLEGTVAHVPPNGGRKHAQQELVRIDTTHILFICGGAFSELVPIIERRLGHQSLGFCAELIDRAQRSVGETLAQVRTEDLLKFGLIPEFIGRMPVVAALEELDEGALVRVLTEPKNALSRQYEKLFELDGVRLRFTDSALRVVAREAIAQKIGARGIRSILECALLELMYEVPGQADIVDVVITEDVIARGDSPLVTREQRRAAS